jgi:hypothetical protein
LAPIPFRRRKQSLGFRRLILDLNSTEWPESTAWESFLKFYWNRFGASEVAQEIV